MAERQTPAPRGGRPQDYRGSGQYRPAPPRRNDVIRCENCGEDYSITYKRCPFCDERPGRGGVSGRRVANTRGGGYGRPASALKTVSWIASFVVVCAALFIIYRFMGAPIFGGGRKPDPNASSSSTSSSVDKSGVSSTDPGAGDVSTPGSGDPDPGTTNDNVSGTIVNAGSGLNVRSGPGRDNSVLEKIANGTPVTVLGEENGWYQIQYGGDKTGYVSADYVSTTQAPVTPDPVPPTEPDPVEPTPPTEPEPEPGNSGSVTSGTQGTIVGDVRIRSGPGTDHSVVASALNGSKVTVLGEENGWYQVRYNGDKTGYVRKDLISIP